ncbi:hypothetical protein GCM10011611_22530 [Aliidongia dinghuensis]|uniref:LPXTG cell wall anchor domain-containing protein n=1 Tax=Aliidongia dinghuensis TaxID=1867774 RepID=A0A8J2YSV4_9PROT|nr:hypothetical protein [Aliidongia dinghuensis]GGF16256.1 hypothetical protein GCM10011611_22530 [Aliidongia dinghuensis]
MRNLLHAAAVLVMSAFLVLNPTIADAKATGSSSSGRSSNGYSRPMTPPSPPVTAAPSAPSPSAPSSGTSSRGYSLPGQSASPSTAAPSTTAPRVQSGSDAALSRQASGSALKSYTAQQERAAYARSAPPPTPVTPAFSRYSGHYSSYDSWYSSRSAWYGGMGWGPPVYAYRSYPSFGMWDALFLWFMLDSISNASHAAWFYNHQQDPGYVDWRREADRLAADNADLRQKLDDLDGRTKALEGQPRDPNYMPADTKPELALASEHAVTQAPPSTGHPTLYFVLGMAVVLGGLLVLRRSRLV